MLHDRRLQSVSQRFGRTHAFPQLEATPDISRGEQRLAAEVTLADGPVPSNVKERAFAILEVMARG